MEIKVRRIRSGTVTEGISHGHIKTSLDRLGISYEITNANAKKIGKYFIIPTYNYKEHVILIHMELLMLADEIRYSYE